MSSPDLIVAQERCGTTTLPVNPFVSNRYHFGMLLGVADFETDQAYHRGKTWLHNAWLHGIGVVWGLDVTLRAEANEVVVGPGLAIDAHGRELSVAEPMCVDLGAWFAQRRPDNLEVDTLPDGDVTFTVHVELCHDSCLDRPVPSISEPCEDASFDTAYSRAVERGLPRIVVPRPEPDLDAPRLREFFGQLPVTNDLVAQARAAVEAAAPSERAAVCLTWFRLLAAADVTELRPEQGAPMWSPVAGDGCVPLAELRVRLHPDGDVFTVVVDPVAPTEPEPDPAEPEPAEPEPVEADPEPDPAEPVEPEPADPPPAITTTSVDPLIRPSLVRTRTIQELLCHAHAVTAPLPPGPPDEDGEPDEPDPDEPAPDPADPSPDANEEPDPVSDESGAFRAVAGSASISGTSVDITFSSDVDPITITPSAFAVSVLRSDGWHESKVARARVDDTDARVVRITLGGAPQSRPVRIVATGTGTRPVLSITGAVLAGVEGDPLVPSGSDAALMITDTATPEKD
jgi:hypothetical protein